MQYIPSVLKLEIIQYLKINSFIKICILNKEYGELCKEYLRTKKLEFERNKTKKTIHNCLYKVTNNTFSPPTNEIAKIVKVVPSHRNKSKKKIYYWVISKMGKIGNKHSIYPQWTDIWSLEDDKFIPFY